MSLLVFLKSDFFFQTEYERRGEVIVDFNDLLWNKCSMSEILNANFETNVLIPKYSNLKLS